MSGSEPLVLTDVSDGVATLTLNNPDERNTLTAPMVAQILEAMDAFEADEGVGALVVTGTPPAFCAGANLGNLAEATGESLGTIYEGFLRIARSPLPTLAAVNGSAVGAGMNLALGCDVRIVADSAKLDTRFLQLGIHPGGGHTWMLRRIVGPQAAMAAVVFGQVLDGKEAERIGLAYRSVPSESLLEVAHEFAAKAAQRAPRTGDRDQADDPGNGRCRRSSRRGRTRTRAAALEYQATVVRRAPGRAAGPDLEEVAPVSAAGARGWRAPIWRARTAGRRRPNSGRTRRDRVRRRPRDAAARRSSPVTVAAIAVLVATRVRPELGPGELGPADGWPSSLKRSCSRPQRPRRRRYRPSVTTRMAAQAPAAISSATPISMRCDAIDDSVAPIRSPPTVALPASAASGTSAVGSKACHPVCGNQTSTQAWASLARTFHTPDTRSRSPGTYPVARRAGTPWLRSMIVSVDAICSQ